MSSFQDLFEARGSSVQGSSWRYLSLWEETEQGREGREVHSHSHSHSNSNSHTCPVPFRVSWKKNEVADTEATTFAIFYNNTLYLFLVLFLLYFMRSFNPALYPLPSLSLSFISPFLSLTPSVTVYLLRTHVPSMVALP